MTSLKKFSSPFSLSLSCTQSVLLVNRSSLIVRQEYDHTNHHLQLGQVPQSTHRCAHGHCWIVRSRQLHVSYEYLLSCAAATRQRTYIHRLISRRFCSRESRKSREGCIAKGSQLTIRMGAQAIARALREMQFQI